MPRYTSGQPRYRRPSGGGGLDRQLSADRPGPKRPLMTESILRQSREAESALADALVSLLKQIC